MCTGSRAATSLAALQPTTTAATPSPCVTYRVRRHAFLNICRLLTSLNRAAGSYTLVVSSFQPQHLADFSLSLASSIPLEVMPIPAEGAGMYTRQAKGAWEEGLDGGREKLLRNPRFGLQLTKPTSVK